MLTLSYHSLCETVSVSSKNETKMISLLYIVNSFVTVETCSLSSFENVMKISVIRYIYIYYNIDFIT